MTPQPAIPFPASLGGDVIACRTEEDAAGIARADAMLAKLDAPPLPWPTIEYLSALLRAYGRHRASRTLLERNLDTRTDHKDTSIAAPQFSIPGIE